MRIFLRRAAGSEECVGQAFRSNAGLFLCAPLLMRKLERAPKITNLDIVFGIQSSLGVCTAVSLEVEVMEFEGNVE